MNNNKGRRQELTYLKFVKRLKKWGLLDKLNDSNSNLYAFRHHGKPCSCYLCRGPKYREQRQKYKKLKNED